LAATLDPKNGKVALSLADLARLRSNRQEMSRQLQKAFKDPSLSIDLKVQTVLQLLQESQADSTLHPLLDSLSLSLCETHAEEAKAFALRGDILSRQEKNLEAIAAYRESLKLDQKQPKYLVWQQLLLLLHSTEQWDQLKKEAEAALELFPQLPMPYYFRGAAQYQQKQYSQAVQSLKNGLNLASGDKVIEDQFCGLLGDAAYQAGQFAESNKAYEQALSHNPNNVYVLNNYAWHLSLRKESLTKALEMSQKANNLEPGNANLLDTQAWVFFQLGKFPEALTWIEKALQASQNEASAGLLEHKGDILFKLNRTDEAREFWIKAKNKGASQEKLLKKIESGNWVE
jgi:tetratricopeptide (TPR) repeat protein